MKRRTINLTDKEAIEDFILDVLTVPNRDVILSADLTEVERLVSKSYHYARYDTALIVDLRITTCPTGEGWTSTTTTPTR